MTGGSLAFVVIAWLTAVGSLAMTLMVRPLSGNGGPPARLDATRRRRPARVGE